MERTLVIIKPNAVVDQNWYPIIKHYELAGLTVERAELFLLLPAATVASLYREHERQPFYPGLDAFMRCGPVIALCVSGNDAVARVREVNGATRPEDAKEGTLRNLYGYFGFTAANAVHGSATVADAERELELLFPRVPAIVSV